MKRLLTTLFLASLFMTSAAQITIYHDTVSAVWPKDGSVHALKDSLINNTGSPVTVTWNRSYESLLTGWTGIGICDPVACYGYDNSTHSYTLAAGEKCVMYVDMKAAVSATDGNNYVTLKLNDGVSDKYMTYKFSSWPARLKDYESNNVVSIYPNPASNFLNINILDTRVSNVTVVNIIGKRVATFSIDGNTSNPMWIPLDNIAKGIYMVQFSDENGKLLGLKRVTKQ